MTAPALRATLWWVRHGPTHARGMVGWSDLPADLSDVAALNRLDMLLPGDATVVSSDLLRARTTADAIQGGRRRLPDDAALREMHFGHWELRRHDEIAAEDPLRARAFAEDPASTRPPGGESWAELTARVDAAADALAGRGGDIVVVAHFGAILSQVQRALRLQGGAAFDRKIDTLSVTRLDLCGDPPQWRTGPINRRP